MIEWQEFKWKLKKIDSVAALMPFQIAEVKQRGKNVVYSNSERQV